MSASIIWPVAAAHRHLFRVHGIRALRLFPAVVLLLCGSVLAAKEAPSRQSLKKDSFYLSSAGFRVQFANDPAGQKRCVRCRPTASWQTGLATACVTLMPNRSIASVSSSVPDRPMTITARSSARLNH
jgi:hypothetical protein